MKEFIIILLLFTLIHAQYEWSEPIQISDDGIYPDISYRDPAITVESGGVVHAIWLKNIKYDTAQWYTHIEQRQSYNNGLSWSDIEIVNPENNNIRLHDLKSVCDSNGKLHILYLKGNINPYSVIHQEYDCVSWSEPFEVSNSATSNLRITIDNNDRIYATWHDGCAYYTYLNGDWITPAKIDELLVNSISDFTFDINNNAYAVGISGDVYDYRPVICKYDKTLEDWSDIDVINNFSENSWGCTIAISKNDTLQINIAVGPTMGENDNYILKKAIESNFFTNPEFINTNNDVTNRKLFRDNDNHLHLFENNWESTVNLIYSSQKNGFWNTDTIATGSDLSYGYSDVWFDNADEFYLIYRESSTSTLNSRIYFQTKRIEVGITEPEASGVTDYKLLQNYPNPFNNETNIVYALRNVGNVKLLVYNSKGEIVETLVDKRQNEGVYSIVMNADKLNSGIYYYQLINNEQVIDTKKMLYLR